MVFEELNKLIGKITNNPQSGGKIKKEEYWGFKNLAYQVKKSRKGHYLFFILESSGKVIHELGSQIKLTQDIIRHLFIKIKENSNVNRY